MSEQNTFLLYTPPVVRYKYIDGSVGFHGPAMRYRGTSLGEIQSCCRGEEWRSLLLYPDRHGYLFCTISYKGEQKLVYAHIVTCLLFNGPRPGPEYMVLHRPHMLITDCRAESLYWGTSAQNAADRLIDGTDHRGEKSPNAKLNNEKVRRIRESRAPFRVLAKEFGVSVATIRKAYFRETWNVDLGK